MLSRRQTAGLLESANSYLRDGGGAEEETYIEASTKKEKKAIDAIRTWLEKQNADTIHRPVRKRFECDPYTVNNMMDVWEYDLLDVQAYGKYYDNHRYILSVIDVFLKFLHMIPIKTPRRLGPYSMTRNILAGVPCRYALIRAKNLKMYFSGHVT